MEKNNKSTDPIKTVLIITVGFLFLYLITKVNLLLLIAFIIGLIGIISNYIAIKIDFLWLKLTWILSKIVPNILLTIFFYFFLTPIALLSRFFDKKDPLKLINNSNSVFKINTKAISKSSFEKPW